MLATVRARYEGFGPTLAYEKLTQGHGVPLSVETLRHWMIAEGLWVERASRGTLLVFVDDATSALMALLFCESGSARQSV